MTDVALEVTNLTVAYPGYAYRAIENVSFSVDKGTITALIGPNGSGKTSIIRAVLGLVDYNGEIKVFGKPIRRSSSQIGYVPQRFSFDPTFPVTVFEFISMVLPSGQREDKLVAEALEYVEGTDLVDKKLSILSGGQLQRVLLARALVTKP
jgi:ABC-type Mn2+/Zn2+ transport system ATPase subunit